jgi:uncharacterized protein
LKYLEEHVLGFTRTSDEVPGYEIPWLYFDYLRSGDARPLGGVFYHNAMDVVAMAALFGHVSEMLADPYNGRVEHGLDFIALGKLFEDLGHWDEAARLYERGLSPGWNEADFGVAVKRLSILQKSAGYGSGFTVVGGGGEEGSCVRLHRTGKVSRAQDTQCEGVAQVDEVCTR